MIKVLIVDDEVLVRRGLSKIIGDYSSKYQICGLADDGEEAIKIAEKEFPDIIITDIKMHNMSGLELVKWAKTNLPSAYSVVISGYDEVEFLHEAIRNRVSEYLLKPVDKKRLFAVLDQIAEKIEERNEMLKKLAVAERSGSNYMTNFFKDLFYSDKIKKEESITLLADMGVRIEGEKRMCVLTVKNKLENNDDIKNSEDEELFNFGIKNIFDEMLTEVGIKFAGYISKEIGYILYLLVAPNVDIRVVTENICRKIKEVINQELSVGVSEIYGDIEYTSTARKNAEMALHSRLVGDSGVYEYNPEGCRLEHNVAALNFSQQLAEAIEKNDDSKAVRIIDAFDSVVSAEGECPQLYIIKSVEDFLYRVRIFLNKKPGIMNEYIEGLLEFDLIRFETLEQVKDYLKELSLYIIDQTLSQHSRACSKKVYEAQKYINDFYYENITLNETAKRLCISSNYLSERFKKEMGETFIDYLTRVRVETAKKLLEENDLSIGQISEMVGYENSTYFSKVFKKYTGMSPNFYRTKMN